MSDFKGGRLPSISTASAREAYEDGGYAGLGSGSYQAPGGGGNVHYFIISKNSFGGGMSTNADEYPFFGGWSSRNLNEKPQSIKVDGKIMGNGLYRRNLLIEALRQPTSDDSPGWIDLPTWGRFAVIVETWEASDTPDAQGRIDLSLTFTRAGISEANRTQFVETPTVDSARALVQFAAKDVFKAALNEESLSNPMLQAGFGEIVSALLNVVGRIQGAKTVLNGIANQVLNILDILNQGIRSPGELASALFGAVDAIAAGIIGVGNTAESELEGWESLFSKAGIARNTHNLAMLFLSNAHFALKTPVATWRDLRTKQETERLMKIVSFIGAAQLLVIIPDVSRTRLRNLAQLFLNSEALLDQEDPMLLMACSDLRIATLSQMNATASRLELTRQISGLQPVLSLAKLLGVEYDDFISLNPGIADQFAVHDEVIYV